MTDKQDPIAHAARLLREAAEELRQAHAYNNSEGWENETDAKAAYDEHMAAAQALEDWEAAVGAGGVQALSAAPKAAPQQEAQEPAFWMNEKGHTWSHSDWKQFPKHRAKYPIPLYPHFPAPQPAPACHHRPPCAECASLTAQGGK